MKKKTYIAFLLLIVLVSCENYAAKYSLGLKSKKFTDLNFETSDTIVEAWIYKDSLFLSKLKKTINKNPKNISHILGVDKHNKKNIGFGYNLVNASKGKGYVSIWFTFIFKEDELVSFELKPGLPKNKDLLNRYLRFYKGIFKIDDERIYHRYYNYDEMCIPIEYSYSNDSVNDALRFLMTPFSGIDYGYSGGITGSVFLNRELFILERNAITPKICKILMYSKNPAVRLLAIEHYLKNRKSFDNTHSIDKWKAKVFNELPSIGTMEGCISLKRDSRELVNKYLNKNY